jgi:hypothetical protein
MIKDGEVYDNLLSFQLNVVKRPFENGKDFECDYDFASYFRHIGADKETKLRKEKTSCSFKAAKEYSDWPTFAKETVWYGRRKGATLYNIN